MRRVVVTGLGIVSPIGNNADEVLASLKAGTSGITANADMAEHGFRSQVAGAVKLNVADHVDKRTLRFMGPGAAYAYIAMQQAIDDAGLEEDQVVNPMTGVIAGSGGPSTSAMLAAHQVVLNSGATKRIGPFAVPKTMSSTVSANLATAFKIKGMNFSITSACSTSLHCKLRSASKTRCLRAAARSWTGHCRACLTRWARCRPSITTRPRRPLAPLMRVGMVL